MATLTYEERKERVNELRKAHFYLGFDDVKLSTDYKLNYSGKESEGKSQPQNIRPDQDAIRFEEYRKNPRQTHYELGIDQDKDHYQSITHQSYKSANNQEKANLSENTKQDLRSHHFVLGFHSAKDPSEYKREFLQKEGQQTSQSDKAEMQNFLRKHNHDFGDKNTYYRTSYEISHNDQYDKEYLKQALGKEDLRKKTVEIRQTNIKIGNHNPDYMTQHQRVFDEKTQQRNNKEEKEMEAFLKGSHLKMGTDNTADIRSVAKTTYQGHQPSERYVVNKDQVRDFRATHFNLAHQQESIPETTTKSHFASAGANTVQKPCIQKNSFYIDQGLSKEQYLDQYNSVYKNGIGKGVPIEIPEIHHNKRVSSLVFGSDEVTEDHFKTEANKKFIHHTNFEKTQLNTNMKDNLSKHHFELGTDNEKWLTNNSQYNAVGPRTNLDPQTMKDLRTHHFKYGTQKNTYQLHSQEIGSKQGPPNIMEKEQQNDLRAHHFKEEGDGNYVTTYWAQTHGK